MFRVAIFLDMSYSLEKPLRLNFVVNEHAVFFDVVEKSAENRMVDLLKTDLVAMASDCQSAECLELEFLFLMGFLAEPFVEGLKQSNQQKLCWLQVLPVGNLFDFLCDEEESQ